MAKSTTVVHRVRLGSLTARLAAPVGDHIERKLRKGGFYESDLLSHLQELEIGGTYVDVGAHIGNHSVAFALMGARRVVAFEPQAEMYAALVLNVSINRLRHRVFASRSVVHDSWEGATIETTIPGNTGATRFTAGIGPFPVRRLDVALPGHGRAGLIKIDVEGHELAVLRSAEHTLRRDRPVVVCEAHDEERLAELDDHLGSRGYRTDGRAWCATPTYVWHPVR